MHGETKPTSPEKMKALLDEQYDWPAQYTFKFVVPKEKLTELLEKVPRGKTSKRESRSGKYISLTVKETFQQSQGVIDVYQRVSTVEGLISL